MTDWIMIWITAVYVIATIAICVANIKSADATRKQLQEQQRQFNESNRAFVTVTFEIVRSGLAMLRIQNNGKQIAQNVQISISEHFMSNIKNQSEKEHLEKLSKSRFNIGIGQSWYCLLGSHLDLSSLSKEMLHIDISYFDNISDYSESTDIDLKQYLWSIIYESPVEDIYQQMKKQTKFVENINKSISTIEKIYKKQYNE